MSEETMSYNVIVHKASIALMGGESLGQFTCAIGNDGNAFIKKKFNIKNSEDGYAYLAEVFAKDVVFSVWTKKSGGKLYSVPYTRNKYEFSFGAPSEVERKTTFVSKAADDNKGYCEIMKLEDVSKPFPNEHAARQTDPKQYEKFARSHPPGFPAGVDVVYGIKIVGGKKKSEIQTIRFKSNMWTPEKAKKWLKDHKFKTGLEVATKPVKKDFWNGVF